MSREAWKIAEALVKDLERARSAREPSRDRDRDEFYLEIDDNMERSEKLLSLGANVNFDGKVVLPSGDFVRLTDNRRAISQFKSQLRAFLTIGESLPDNRLPFKEVVDCLWQHVFSQESGSPDEVADRIIAAVLAAHPVQNNLGDDDLETFRAAP